MINPRLQICTSAHVCYEFLRAHPVRGNQSELPGKWISKRQLRHELDSMAILLRKKPDHASKLRRWLGSSLSNTTISNEADLITKAHEQSWGVYKYTGVNAHKVLDNYIQAMALASSILTLWKQEGDTNSKAQYGWQGRNLINPETDGQKAILVRFQALLRFCKAHPRVGSVPIAWVTNSLPSSIAQAAHHESVPPPEGYSSWSAWEDKMAAYGVAGIMAATGVMGVIRIGTTYTLSNPLAANEVGMFVTEVIAGDAVGGASLRVVAPVVVPVVAKVANEVRGILGANSGGHLARQVLSGGNNKSIAGHGHFASGSVVIPKGSSLLVPKHGTKILDATGRVLETIDPDLYVKLDSKARRKLVNRQLDQLDITNRRLRQRVLREMKGVQVFNAGDVVPNYTISAPKNLRIFDNSTTVNSPTPLGDILKPDTGLCILATCTEIMSTY